MVQFFCLQEVLYVEKILKAAHQWMDEYMKSFYCDDKDIMFGIQMKEKHTGYVTAHARELALHLKLDDHDARLAELIGLLHDVGRFRQWQLYKTFVDARSEDHADLGVKVIRELPFYGLLADEDKEIVLFAIRNHNKKEIAATDSPRQLLFARIIRDADKLDIFRVLAPYLTEDGAAQSGSTAIRNFMKGPNGSATGEKGVFAPGFLERFVNGQQVDYTMIRTNEDRKLVRLMWVYDVNFAWTLRRIRDKGYIDAIVANLPPLPQVELGVRRLEEYVAKKCCEDDVVCTLDTMR